MIRSFRTIEKELKNKHIPLDHKWALLHAIHTTADFEMEHLLHTDEGAVASLYQAIEKGGIKTIVTDVTMAASGIRKGALQRLGIEVKCYLGDPRTATMAAEKASPVPRQASAWLWRSIPMLSLYSAMHLRHLWNSAT